jgi:hypothetical protein
VVQMLGSAMNCGNGSPQPFILERAEEDRDGVGESSQQQFLLIIVSTKVRLCAMLRRSQTRRSQSRCREVCEIFATIPVGLRQERAEASPL